MKVSNSNDVYAYTAVVETEFSNGKEAKVTWLSCQGYTYKADPGDHVGAVFRNRRAVNREPRRLHFLAELQQTSATNTCSLLKHCLFLVRSKPEFAFIYDGDGNNYKITLSQANLCVHKITVSDQVFTVTEKVLTKTPALYRYTDVSPKTYLIPQGSRS